MFRTSVYLFVVVFGLAAPSQQGFGKYDGRTEGEPQLAFLSKRVFIINPANNGREVPPEGVSIFGRQIEAATMSLDEGRVYRGKGRVYGPTSEILIQKNRLLSAEFMPPFGTAMAANLDVCRILYSNVKASDNRRHLPDVFNLNCRLYTRPPWTFTLFERTQRIVVSDIWTTSFNAKPWLETGLKLTDGKRVGGIGSIDRRDVSGSGDLYCVKGSIGAPLGFFKLFVEPIGFGGGPRLFVFYDFMGSNRCALGGKSSPAGEDQANNKSGEFERGNSNRYSGKPVAFLDGLHSRPLRAEISIIPILWVIAIGMIGFGSYRGFFARERRDTVSGWLIFIIGITLQLCMIELLISGVT
ncbi:MULTISPECIES: hypothetical protein [unclassified Mesorhizobium]|uniref:hypothetical protein n=1 Tax=unclassified Mesorhizobium TaxID=325217 RepID=UPI00333AE24A